MRLEAANLAELGRVRHGFFTREGGVSREGVFASLNCGFGSGDEADAIAENRARVAAALGTTRDNLLSLYQIHSDAVITVEQPWGYGPGPQADAMVTRVPGLALGVLTADCVPLLMADAEAGVVAAVHAGWKGAIAGIAERALDRMVELGAEPWRITAALGPCIGPHSYEVGPEFREQFVAQDENNQGFFESKEGGDRYLFDLPGYVQFKLVERGLFLVEWIGNDTYRDEAQFFSHRRNSQRGEPRYGRLISAIMLSE